MQSVMSLLHLRNHLKKPWHQMCENSHEPWKSTHENCALSREKVHVLSCRLCMTRTYRSEKSMWWTKIKEIFMLISWSKLRVKKGLCSNIPVVNITMLNVKFDNLSYFPNSAFHIPIYSFFHFHMFSLSSFKPGLFILKALSTRLKSFIPFLSRQYEANRRKWKSWEIALMRLLQTLPFLRKRAFLPQVPTFEYQKMGYSKWNHLFTPTTPQNGGVGICVVHLLILGEVWTNFEIWSFYPVFIMSGSSSLLCLVHIFA